MDLAQTPSSDETLEDLEMITGTHGGEQALAKARRDNALRDKVRARAESGHHS